MFFKNFRDAFRTGVLSLIQMNFEINKSIHIATCFHMCHSTKQFKGRKGQAYLEYPVNSYVLKKNKTEGSSAAIDGTS